MGSLGETHPDVAYIKQLVSSWLRNDDYIPPAQMIVSFTLGLVFSPWGWGVFWLVAYSAAYEIIYYILVAGDRRYWQLETRIGALLSTFLGWVVGRTIVGLPILQSGIEAHVPQASSRSRSIRACYHREDGVDMKSHFIERSDRVRINRVRACYYKD